MVICLIFLPLKIEKSRKFHSDVDEIAMERFFHPHN